MKSVLTALSGGLSPLARGTRYKIHSIDELGRFIPAGAGNTNGKPRNGSGALVYPRWRGEHDASRPQP